MTAAEVDRLIGRFIPFAEADRLWQLGQARRRALPFGRFKGLVLDGEFCRKTFCEIIVPNDRAIGTRLHIYTPRQWRARLHELALRAMARRAVA